jgi:hypothetical protein
MVVQGAWKEHAFEMAGCRSTNTRESTRRKVREARVSVRAAEAGRLPGATDRTSGSRWSPQHRGQAPGVALPRLPARPAPQGTPPNSWPCPGRVIRPERGSGPRCFGSMVSAWLLAVQQGERPGRHPAAPGDFPLPLLPPGPDGVRRAPPRRTRPNARSQHNAPVLWMSTRVRPRPLAPNRVAASGDGRSDTALAVSGGGEGGIRTRGAFRLTRSPGARVRPDYATSPRFAGPGQGRHRIIARGFSTPPDWTGTFHDRQAAGSH